MHILECIANIILSLSEIIQAFFYPQFSFMLQLQEALILCDLHKMVWFFFSQRVLKVLPLLINR